MLFRSPPRGKQRDEYEGQSKDKYDLFAEERVLRPEANAVAARARAEADRVIMAANAEAARASAEDDRVIMVAARTRAESDRDVARERLLLQHKLAALTNQPYHMGTPTAKSNIYEHGENDTQPWRNGRPDQGATEDGAQIRGEKNLTNKKAGPI